MTGTVYPADAVSGAPSYTGRLLRNTQMAPLLASATVARPLGAISGVRPGTLSSIVTATSTTWTVTPFAGIIDAEAAAAAGPYGYAFQANQTGSVTAAAGGSDRYDRLDVVISDPAEADGSSVPLVTVVYTAGTAGAGVAPAAPSRSHPLATIFVPQSGGGSPSIIWTARYSAAAGGVVPFNTSTDLLTTTGYTGQLATHVSDSTNLYPTLWMWSGTAWQPIGTGGAEVAITPATGWTAGTGTNAPRIKRQGKQVTLYGSLAWAGGGTYAAMFTAPAAFLPLTLSTQRQIGTGAQLTGSSLINFLAVLNTSGVVGNGTGSTGSLPASGTVLLNGLSWWMD